MWSVLPVLLLASVALAAPFEALDSSSFTVRAAARKHKFKRNGALAMAMAYSKYHVKIPDNILVAIELDNTTSVAGRAPAATTTTKTSSTPTVTGSVANTPEPGDSEYLCPVYIGSNKQLLNLDFDTGSSDLWVFSTGLSKTLQTGHSVYNPSTSTSSKLLSGSSWKISYGDGSSASGSVYTDAVNIGGITYPAQAVEAATQISSQFTQDVDNDGLVGLAFSTINTVSPTKQKTFFDNIKPNLSQPLFAADLHHGKTGYYDFGYINSARYTGSIAYTTVDSSRGYWGFTSPGYKVGTTSYTTSLAGIADTGTTLLLLPDAVVANYYSKVTGSSNSKTYGGYVFPCSATLPNFTYMIGSLGITIPGTYFNYSPVKTGSTTCFGSLQSSSGIGINIYGDIALKAAYVIFNAGTTPQLGFAAKTLP